MQSLEGIFQSVMAHCSLSALMSVCLTSCWQSCVEVPLLPYVLHLVERPTYWGAVPVCMVQWGQTAVCRDLGTEGLCPDQTYRVGAGSLRGSPPAHWQGVLSRHRTPNFSRVPKQWQPLHLKPHVRNTHACGAASVCSDLVCIVPVHVCMCTVYTVDVLTEWQTEFPIGEQLCLIIIIIISATAVYGLWLSPSRVLERNMCTHHRNLTIWEINKTGWTKPIKISKDTNYCVFPTNVSYEPSIYVYQ